MVDTLAERRRFPGVLWILPIFFGLIGGIIAALISGLKYQASWWELLLVGFLINVVIGVIYFALAAAMFPFY